MKKILIGAVAIVSLTGCTRVVEVQTTVPATEPTVAQTTSPAIEEPTDYGMSPREQFLIGVNSLVAVPYYVSEDLLWDAGNEVCGLARSGYNLDEISGELVLAADFDEQVMEVLAAVGAAAIMFICPEYEYLFDEAPGF